MTAPTLTSAWATSFRWISFGTDIALSFPTGPSCSVTVPSDSYSVFLTIPSFDFIRVVESAVNARMVAIGRSETFSLSLLSEGKLRLSISSGTFSFTGSRALSLLGFESDLTSTSSKTARFPPAYFCTFVERTCADWSPKILSTGSTTANGGNYGFYSSVYRFEDEITFGFIPRDPATKLALGLNQTPWMPDQGVVTYPDIGYDTSFPRQWTVLDSLRVVGRGSSNLCLGNLQNLISDTTLEVPFNIASPPFSEIYSPRKERVREGWDAYFRWTSKWIAFPDYGKRGAP